ncbi:ABC transporter permease [Tenuibacillus multivorans]|uniref:ABC-2 type transport system permease protein n=1 Tax=Tenuibacillus multivorans TaxID=237069 RepID=A0A1G9YGX3_9BACI|nr:ABC transporter permease [Tenuibacillus multivorans]GEL78515.1 transport permease protein [Tenuibacillus multivorans]SDN08317.1 ABC-2 type transport system permease protein [Tenuibacillus multivorans]
MRIQAIVRRIVRQFKRDKRSLGLMIVAPLLVLTLIWLVLDGDDYEPKIAYDNLPNPFVDTIDDYAQEIVSAKPDEANELLKDGEVDAFITIEEATPIILLEGSEPTSNSAVMRLFQEAVSSIDTGSPIPEPEVEFYYGLADLGLFDRTGPVLIGFFVFFFVFIIGGISFLRERTQGTLEKLLSTPIKRWELVSGYVIGFGIFTIIQSLIIVLYSIYVLDMFMVGNFWELLLVTILLAITALTLATLLSSFANNEFQIMQFIPIVIVPQVFFSGIFNLETLDTWIQVLSQFMPLTYGAEALQSMMIKGQGIQDVWFELLILFGFALIFFILNIRVLKKHRAL